MGLTAHRLLLGTVGAEDRPSETVHETVHDTRSTNIADLRVNDSIRAKEVRVVAPDGSQVGVKPLREALWLADQLGLDLVEVAPMAKPPVARLMDYGKYKYEQSVKDREARKKQTRSTVKEITFKVKIGDHDYQIKRDRAAKFLAHGDKVRVRIWFRGREASRPELGRKILDRLATELSHVGKVEQDAKQEGRNMTMAFAPLPKEDRAKKRPAKEEPVAGDAPADEPVAAVEEPVVAEAAEVTDDAVDRPESAEES